jgi:hypothetical protein
MVHFYHSLFTFDQAISQTHYLFNFPHERRVPRKHEARCQLPFAILLALCEKDHSGIQLDEPPSRSGHTDKAKLLTLARMCVRNSTVKCHNYIRSMVGDLNMSMKYCLNDPARGKPKYLDRNLFQGPFVCHKPHRK